MFPLTNTMFSVFLCSSSEYPSDEIVCISRIMNNIKLRKKRTFIQCNRATMQILVIPVVGNGEYIFASRRQISLLIETIFEDLLGILVNERNLRF